MASSQHSESFLVKKEKKTIYSKILNDMQKSFHVGPKPEIYSFFLPTLAQMIQSI